MAQKKISALDEAVSVIGTDVLPVVESGVTKKVEVETLLASKMLNNKVWCETRASANSFKVSPTIEPSFEKLTDDGAGSQGIYTYVFSDDRDEEIYFAIHLPSFYKVGTDVYPHFHFMPGDTGTGNVKINVEYYLCVGAYCNSTLITKTLALDGVREHKDIAFDAIAGGGFAGIDNQFLVRLRRDVGVGSNYAGNIFLLEFTLSFERDQVGTGTRTAK